MKKVDAIETYVDRLNAKMDEKVSGLDSKLNVILNILFETNKSGPTTAEKEAQLDQLISL